MNELTRVESVTVRGFRSLADVELCGLGNTNVLIGANGAGKSNFIRFFEMLRWMLRTRKLDEYVQRNGGADDQLFGGSKITREIHAEIQVKTRQGRNDYKFTLSRAHPNRFIFTEEAYRFSRSSSDFESQAPWQNLEIGGTEARITDAAQSSNSHEENPQTARAIVNLLTNCNVYQFHDTSDSSRFKSSSETGDNKIFRSHGGNLASILFRLEQEDVKRFDRICRQIRRVLPVFDRFQIEEQHGKVDLRWKAKGSDTTYGAHLTSDGSLRFFALVTLLNLPSHMLPNVLLLDEPELGLHPAAITIIGGMINSLASEKQVIVATQSPLLVDSFSLETIWVLDLDKGKTKFSKRTASEFDHWLDESYTAGDLWQKNLLGGRP